MSPVTRLPQGSICLPAASLSSEAHDMQHATTCVGSRFDAVDSGCTRWERRYADGTAWFEWDWDMAGGSPTQLDPFNVRSNVLLLDERGRPLLSSRRRAMLAQLVYLLPWQGPVLDEIRVRQRRTDLEDQYHRAAA